MAVLASAVSVATVASAATVVTAGAKPGAAALAGVGSGARASGQAPWATSVLGSAEGSAAMASAAMAVRAVEVAREARRVTWVTVISTDGARPTAREVVRWSAKSTPWVGTAFRGQVQVEGVASE